ncbi:hypothetical protein LJC44_00675 [Parabacteroides sp. OttesenSCG-928-G06]|nr:hypothetical protein [Parabacteroides sp. OttesenSCG-928-G06]
MKTADIYQYMQDPSSLSKETLSEWQAIVDDFPWFQTARALYLKNLALTEDIRFNQELSRMAIYLPDRKKLFMQIEGERYGLIPGLIPHETDKNSDFSLIDSFLSSFDKQDESQKSSLLFHSSVSSDYVYWAMSNDAIAAEDSSAKPMQHQSLIDSFIRKEEERESGSRKMLSEPAEEEPALREDAVGEGGGMRRHWMTPILRKHWRGSIYNKSAMRKLCK